MKIIPSYAMVRARGTGSGWSGMNAGTPFRQRGSRPEALPGFTSRGRRRQQQHPGGKSKKEKKASFALKGCKPLGLFFSSRLAGMTPSPLFAGTFNDRAVIKACPLVTPQLPPCALSLLGVLLSPRTAARTGVRYRKPQAKRSGQSTWAR